MDSNLVSIDSVEKWINDNFDLEKYSSSTFLFCGVGHITFDVERFITDLKKGLTDGNKE